MRPTGRPIATSGSFCAREAGVGKVTSAARSGVACGCGSAAGAAKGAAGMFVAFSGPRDAAFVSGCASSKTVPAGAGGCGCWGAGGGGSAAPSGGIGGSGNCGAASIGEGATCGAGGGTGAGCGAAPLPGSGDWAESKAVMTKAPLRKTNNRRCRGARSSRPRRAPKSA